MCYAIVMHKLPTVAIGVDLGGTYVRGGVVTPEGEVLFRDKRPSRVDAGLQDALDAMYSLIDGLQCVAAQKGLKAAALGVGCPGPLEPRTGVLLDPPNCPALKDVNLKERLEKRFGMSVFLIKDASASALGERWKGSAEGLEHFVFLSLGTGLGGAVVSQGRIFEGSSGMAAEIGHVSLFPDGPQCSCGSFGCAEVYLSTRSLLSRVKRSMGEDGIWDGPGLQLAQRVALMARSGDKGALEVLEGFGKDLGVLCASLANLYNPEAIVVGGGLANLWEGFSKAAVREIKRRALPNLIQGMSLLKARLGDDAGVIGAASLAFCGKAPKGESIDRRPWGSGDVLSVGQGYKVKRLRVSPQSRLSYQRHFHRDEVWAIVSARSAFVTIDGERRPLKAGDSIAIQKGHLHRLENASDDAELVLIETQIGANLCESDIERIEDDYGRADA